jgi:RimJ/RimL family protein N-acetyltransferase
MQPQSSLVLTTAELQLRPLELSDVDLLWPDISDPQIAQFMAWDAHTDKAQTMAFLQGEIARREAGKGMTWGIFKDSAFCGIISLIALTRSHRSLTYNKAELAYWLGGAHQGQGIMTAAVRRVMQFAFQELGLHKLCVSHFGDNIASQRLIQRCGFRYVGEQIEEFQKDGVWHNHCLYELLAHEFRAAQANQK